MRILTIISVKYLLFHLTDEKPIILDTIDMILQRGDAFSSIFISFIQFNPLVELITGGLLYLSRKIREKNTSPTYYGITDIQQINPK